MQTAAVFKSGNSQAVRLPKQFQVQSARVSIQRKGHQIILTELPVTMAGFLANLPVIPDWPDAAHEGQVDPVAAW